MAPAESAAGEGWAPRLIKASNDITEAASLSDFGRTMVTVASGADFRDISRRDVATETAESRRKEREAWVGLYVVPNDSSMIVNIVAGFDQARQYLYSIVSPL